MSRKPSFSAVVAEIEQQGLAPQKISDYRLHAAAAKTYAIKRIPSCSKYPAAGGLALVKSGRSARFVGYSRCKAHQICPICHTLWLRDQHNKLARLVGRWDGYVSAITLTLPHKRTDSFTDCLRRIQGVRRLFVASKAYKARWIAGTVLRVEVSIGVGGWHPHVHGLLFSFRQPSANDIEDIANSWRTAARSIGCRAGRIAAHAEGLPDINAALRAGSYMCKRGPASPFSLLEIIARSVAPAPIIDAAKSLWREYCQGVVENGGMRYVTVAGAEIKNGWAALSKSTATRDSALSRIERYIAEWDDAGGGGRIYDLAVQYLQHVVADARSAKYDEETRCRIAALEDAIAEAIALRDELGFSGDMDPIGDFDKLSEEVQDLVATTRPKSTAAGLATITPLGASLLTPEYKTALARATSHADVRRIFSELIARHARPLDPRDLYALNYDNQKIVSMYLPSIGAPPSDDG